MSLTFEQISKHFDIHKIDEEAEWTLAAGRPAARNGKINVHIGFEVGKSLAENSTHFRSPCAWLLANIQPHLAH